LSTPLFAVYRIPGANFAFLFSLFLTLGLMALIVPYSKRRPVGTPVTWAEAMLAAMYVFVLFFLAYGVVPHQFITHADAELNWRPDKILTGPEVGGQGLLEYLPFEITYQVIRDIIVVGIYAVFLGLQIFMWSFWQNRGKKKPSLELPASTYGRPLVKKG